MSFQIKKKLAKQVAGHCQMPVEEMMQLIEIPPQSELGDFSLPCFKLSKQLRRPPQVIAAELAKALEGQVEGVSRIEQTGGYLNFFLNREEYVTQLIGEILMKPDEIFPRLIQEEKTALVEFSSPNIAKPFHVGHAFTTILGQSLANLYAKAGYNVVKLNHLGDYGTQFGKLIVAYGLWGDEKALEASPIQELLRIYVLFHQAAKENPELETKARQAFRRLEDGEAEEVALWQRFRDLSLVEFNRVYDRLGIKFDNFNGESFYSDKIPAVVDMLRAKNLLEESDGAQVVTLEEEKLPPCIILKSDGTTIYASRDLAAILYRENKWHFDKNIYVVGIPQALHFRQVFSVLKKAGYECADRCHHVGFGLVKLPEGKMSTREGDVIFLEDLLTEAVNKTKEIIRRNAEERHTDMSESEMTEIAEKVGLGAVVYTFLRNGRERDIVFSWEEMLNFDGDTAPYLQYTYARCQSLLRRADLSLDKNRNLLTEALAKRSTWEDSEFALCRQLELLPQAFANAIKVNEPSILAKQISSVAHAFNKFYADCSIQKAEEEVRLSRLALCGAVSDALREGLALLGIAVVDRM